MIKIVVKSTKGGSGKSTISLGLACTLGGQAVDLDPQGTLNNAKAMNEKLPVMAQSEVRGDVPFVVYDTAPYNNEEDVEYMKNADIIVCPLKPSVADLMSFNTLYLLCKKQKILHKCIVVFNEVRYPINNTYKEVVDIFGKNYPDIKIAKTNLRNLLGIRNIFAEQKCAKSLNNFSELAKELLSYVR